MHCITEGDCVVSNVYWRYAVIGLLADFQARLSIFYISLEVKDKDNNDIDIVKVPIVDAQMLENAIKELEQATSELA